jgi:hypothetical protein
MALDIGKLRLCSRDLAKILVVCTPTPNTLVKILVVCTPAPRENTRGMYTSTLVKILVVCTPADEIGRSLNRESLQYSVNIHEFCINDTP